MFAISFYYGNINLLFVRASFGTGNILLEIHLYAGPHKMQANDFALISYLRYSAIN